LEKRNSVLMIPGPSEVYPEILATLSKPVMPHYGSQWGETYLKICDDLKKIFKTKGDVMIQVGSGTSAMEMAVANLIEPGDKVINIINGYFGELFETLIKTYGGKPISIRTQFGEAVRPDEVRKVARREKDAKAIFSVHNETSMGIVDPIKEIGEVAEETDKLFVVDAISSFGGMDLRMDEWKIDFCIGYASKCLGSIAGLSPFAINERVWETIEGRREPLKAYIISLPVWKRETELWTPYGHPHPTSMPTPNVLALGKAVKIVLSEGLQNRYRRHYVAGRAVREGIRAMGLQVIPEETEASDTVTAVVVPQGAEDKIRRMMQNEFNLLIGGSLPGWGEGKTIRIAHMGMTASPEYIVPTLFSLERVLSKLGFKVEAGSGVSAAMQVFTSHSQEWIQGLLARYRERC